MPIPQRRPPRLRVYWFVVFGLLFSSQFSFGYRWTSSISPSAPQVNFGSLQVGNATTLREVLTNVGQHSITLASATLSGIGFTIRKPSFPLTLNPGESVTLGLTFNPKSGTRYSGTLVVAWGKSGRVKIPVVGTGTGAGSVSAVPTSLSFGNVAVGTSLSKTATLTANGSSSVVRSITTTNSEFTVTGLTLPLTLNVGQSIPFTVKFSPKITGGASANLSFATNVAGSLASQTLSGAGTSASPTGAQHSVMLSWNESTANVAGFNIYRGTTSGGPYTKVNASPNPGSSYTDISVTGGKTYFYVVTSLDGTGAESKRSSEVDAVVPTP
jgi:hypothetical protein